MTYLVIKSYSYITYPESIQIYAFCVQRTNEYGCCSLYYYVLIHTLCHCMLHKMPFVLLSVEEYKCKASLSYCIRLRLLDLIISSWRTSFVFVKCSFF